MLILASLAFAGGRVEVVGDTVGDLENVSSVYVKDNRLLGEVSGSTVSVRCLDAGGTTFESCAGAAATTNTGSYTVTPGTGIFSISASTLPLPTGAATEATLSSINGKTINTSDVTITGPLPAGTAVIGTIRQIGAFTVTPGTGSWGVALSTLPMLPAGTNNIGDVDVLTLPALSAGTNNIGDVDVLSLPALPAGANNIGDVDVLTLPALVTGSAIVGRVGIDQTTPGTTNKVSIGTDGTVAINAALPAGTNAIGKLSANSGVDIGDVDVLSLPALIAGSAVVGKVGQDGSYTVTPGTGIFSVAFTTQPNVGQAGSYTVTPGTGIFSIAFTTAPTLSVYGSSVPVFGLGGYPVTVNPSTQTLKSAAFSVTATGTIIAAVANKKLCVYALVMNHSAAITTNLRDGGASNLEGAMSFAANGGRVENVNPPAYLFRTTAGNSLDLVQSGAGTVAGRLSYWEE